MKTNIFFCAAEEQEKNSVSDGDPIGTVKKEDKTNFNKAGGEDLLTAPNRGEATCNG